ncbi:hypothetical protein HanXRQr2_Chr11g0507051 [Helianthus annuus]|uniref:Uncharacterized protein n=1 Tax=Helianthus annuus TaxID=4232 RepID=A0A9K3HRV4_HELAN|nr:hypothetical protein HanXRQr2_Chr11g0507051 [Helianthus annuus]KAJ0876459.1 hypothetical protein HanPSC8_Chr11g0488691 [Helianthus annuus]
MIQVLLSDHNISESFVNTLSFLLFHTGEFIFPYRGVHKTLLFYTGEFIKHNYIWFSTTLIFHFFVSDFI